VRTPIGISDDTLRAVFDRRRLLQWMFAGRLTLAASMYVGAVFVWRQASQADPSVTLITSLTFAAAAVFTAWSAWRVRGPARQLSRTFLYGQLIFDTLVVTAVVHVTGTEELSLFAALYIVVNTAAAFLLPIGGSLLLAVFGSALYAADVFGWSNVPLNPVLALQVSVFVMAALATSWISSRVQQLSVTSQQLAAELTQVSLEAADILNNIRSGILTVDEQGVLLYANPAASDLLGIDLQAYAGRPVLDHLARVSPGLVAATRRTLDEHSTAQREEAHVDDAARRFPIGVTTTSNEGDGARMRRSVTAIFQDISDQKRLEQFRLRAERLEAVAELSASLAHEIRNPLASIQSAVEQLGRSERSTPDEQALARLIVRESDRLSRLLSEFLDFARTRMTSIGAVDLAAIARGAANLAAAHPSRNDGVDVECVVPPEPVMIDGDEDLLHRAVFNLVLNAVQAAPSGSTVRVDIGPAQEGRLPDGVRLGRNAVALRVSDTGPGIAPEVRDRLFQPFTTTKQGGSGLGLPVVHRAIEAHRGVVLVDSDTTGTRITVILPRKQAPASARPGVAA
jgi:two-component system sensor histidine kinase PilS (NtrC family)